MTGAEFPRPRLRRLQEEELAGFRPEILWPYTQTDVDESTRITKTGDGAVAQEGNVNEDLSLERLATQFDRDLR